jgi:hypothetical protein
MSKDVNNARRTNPSESVKNRGGSYQGKCAIHFLAWHGSGELVDLLGEVGEDQRYVGTKYYCYLGGSLDA